MTLEVPKVDLSEHIDRVEYELHASFGSPPVGKENVYDGSQRYILTYPPLL